MNMDWFSNLFFGTGIAHSICALTLAIALGIFLGSRLKIKGITLGITAVLPHIFDPSFISV